MSTSQKNQSQGLKKSQKRFILLVSILIPLVVGGLFRVKIDLGNTTFLPGIYAGINAVTAMALIMSIIAIKGGNKERHRYLMFFALVLSVLFLILYIIYHMSSEPTAFGGEGAVKAVYYFLLLSHILLSVVVVPLVLMALFYALNGNFISHKKWVKWAYPIWLYVSVSGVVVYLLIQPYYLTN